MTAPAACRSDPLFRRILFGLKFGEKNLVLSSAITKDSRILYVRNPRTRVQKVAPWLTLDGDPYPAVINGRIVWLLDGYTTSSGYPYSERTTFGDAATDANTGTGNRVRAVAQPDQLHPQFGEGDRRRLHR